jgi:hypothetical protein
MVPMYCARCRRIETRQERSVSLAGFFELGMPRNIGARPGADQPDHLLHGEALREQHERLRAAVGAGRRAARGHGGGLGWRDAGDGRAWPIGSDHAAQTAIGTIH